MDTCADMFVDIGERVQKYVHRYVHDHRGKPHPTKLSIPDILKLKMQLFLSSSMGHRPLALGNVFTNECKRVCHISERVLY